jgi:uncharacterized membrane protein
MLEKAAAVIAYLFSLPGALAVAALGRKNRFCLHHARRSLELFLFLALLFCGWFALLYLLILIPYAGFPIAVSLFGIVAAAFLFSWVLCILGILKALRGGKVIFPLITGLMERAGPLWKILGMDEV